MPQGAMQESNSKIVIKYLSPPVHQEIQIIPLTSKKPVSQQNAF